MGRWISLYLSGCSSPPGVHEVAPQGGTDATKTPAEEETGRLWDPEARFHGIKRMTLNNMIQDGSMLREHVYYWLCAELGLPAPRSSGSTASWRRGTNSS